MKQLILFLFFKTSLLYAQQKNNVQVTFTDKNGIENVIEGDSLNPSKELIDRVSEVADKHLESDLSLASYSANLAFFMAVRLNDQNYIGKCNRLKADVHCRMGNFTEAFTFIRNALRIHDSLDLKQEMYYNYNTLGIIYEATGDVDASLSNFLKAYKMIDKENIPEQFTFGGTMNLAVLYKDKNMYDSARFFANKAYDIADKTDDIVGLAHSHFILGSVYFKTNQLDFAKVYFYSSLKLYQSLKSKYTLGASLNNELAQYQLAIGLTDSAIYYAQIGFNDANSLHFKQGLLFASGILSFIYTIKGNVDSAFYYQQIKSQIVDNLYSPEMAVSFKKVNIDATISDMVHEKFKYEKQQEIRKYREYAIVAGILITLYLALFPLIWRFVFNRKVTRFLGVLLILVFFEFINLFFHALLEGITNHSPILIFLGLILLAVFTIPWHHKIEKYYGDKIFPRLEERNLARLINEKKKMSEKISELEKLVKRKNIKD